MLIPTEIENSRGEKERFRRSDRGEGGRSDTMSEQGDCATEVAQCES